MPNDVNPTLPVFITSPEGKPEPLLHLSPANETPIAALDVRPSLLFTQEDNPGQVNEALLDFSLDAIREARKIDLSEISARIQPPMTPTPNTWPGQHYKLLSAMVKNRQPKVVIEIGTASGYSCLSLKKHLPAEGKIVTFDLVPWREYPNTILNETDFADGRLKQHIADLTHPHVFNSFGKLLSTADFIFVDAAKDGMMEQTFLDLFETVVFEKPIFIFFDDIRLWNMLSIWRKIKRPKIDLTSFGSWSGSGLIHWIP